MDSEKVWHTQVTGKKGNFGRRTENFQERKIVTQDSGEMIPWLSKQVMKDYI